MANTGAARVAHEIATVIDDNASVSVGEVLRFETALADNPADVQTRQVYRDWLLENGCETRAAQLADGLSAEAEVYTGEVRPQDPPHAWADL
jgi:uncharacterized protein (TIGR02996 family)